MSKLLYLSNTNYTLTCTCDDCLAHSARVSALFASAVQAMETEQLSAPSTQAQAQAVQDLDAITAQDYIADTGAMPAQNFPPLRTPDEVAQDDSPNPSNARYWIQAVVHVGEKLIATLPARNESGDILRYRHEDYARRAIDFLSDITAPAQPFLTSTLSVAILTHCTVTYRMFYNYQPVLLDGKEQLVKQ